MYIKDMFVKPINRDIKGVIKVGQDEEVNIKQELEEYVVTRELQEHFARFFSMYKKGINDYTDKMGVWISGFFGSGKSHFLKILSYLLENKEVDGKKAVDYFIDDEKIHDNMVIGDMKLAGNTSTDVILFNIDSKSESNGKSSKDAIVSVFLKVFNEMQGFCGSMPFLADLERKLSEIGKYEEFKERFQEINGGIWNDVRHEFAFIQDDIVDVLVKIDFMSEEAARNWCERVTENYSISIESFAELVKEYIDRKGNNHHVVFLVDEIGQYIGEDSKLMLNLQTVTEDLGITCGGKAWIIVTSQEDIDFITKVKGNDFSKIQGRFDTRLSLSSANVDEVIRKRILDKTSPAKQTLTLLYDNKATFIKNLITFNDGIEKKLYADRENFADIYPFIPYQFNILSCVLNSIRMHGASGKHLSEGERSMIALFKESAMFLMNEEDGALIPFNIFYNALHQFIDHSHSGVIIRAMDNEHLEKFDVEVLKVLFMIKYVKEIKANKNNITTLLVSRIDEDRMGLSKKVESSLNRLVNQTLVHASGDLFIFLTNEEQEINREILSIAVDTNDIVNRVSGIIFEELFTDKKYRYSPRYNFDFNKIVDNRFYKNDQSNDVGLKILTPFYSEDTEATTLMMSSAQENNVIVVLPPDNTFLDEIRLSIQIEKFILKNAVGIATKYEKIKAEKQVELVERKSRAKIFLGEALKSAQIYVNGAKAQIGEKDPTARMNEALAKLIATRFHKITYIDTFMSQPDIHKLFQSDNQIKISGLNAATVPNNLALQDMYSYIETNSFRHIKTSLKTLMNRFTKAPYGFIKDDVQWLIAKLFKDGKVSFVVNSENITLQNKTVKEIIRYVTDNSFVDKLLIEKRERPSDSNINTVKKIMKDIFRIPITSDDVDNLMMSLKNHLAKLFNDFEKLEIHYQLQSRFPGKSVIEGGKNLLKELKNLDLANEFFSTVGSKKDDLYDLVEDYEPVKAFFANEQKSIFEKSIKLMDTYDNSKTFIVSKEIEEIVQNIKAVIKSSTPYTSIQKLPSLNDDFIKKYSELLENAAEPIRTEIDEAKKRVFDELAKHSFKGKFIERYMKLFAEISEKLNSSDNIAIVKNISLEVDTLKIRLLNEIDEEAVRESQRQREKQMAIEQPTDDHVEIVVKEPPVIVKVTKNISLKSIVSVHSKTLETEQDIDNFLKDIRAKLLKELSDKTIINIEI